jgi:hypothetical protein
MEYI